MLPAMHRIDFPHHARAAAAPPGTRFRADPWCVSREHSVRVKSGRPRITSAKWSACVRQWDGRSTSSNSPHRRSRWACARPGSRTCCWTWSSSRGRTPHAGWHRTWSCSTTVGGSISGSWWGSAWSAPTDRHRRRRYTWIANCSSSCCCVSDGCPGSSLRGTRASCWATCWVRPRRRHWTATGTGPV